MAPPPIPLPTVIDGLAPATQVVRADDALIPLPGPAAYVDLNRSPDLDFRTPRPIGAVANLPGRCTSALETSVLP